MTNLYSFQSYLSLAIVFLVQFLQDGLQLVQEKVGVRWSEDQSWNQKQNGLALQPLFLGDRDANSDKAH